MKTVIIIAIAIVFVSEAEAQKQPPPLPPPPPVTVYKATNPPAKNAFLKNNPAATDIYWEKKDLLVVKLKDGKVEKYNIADSGSKQSFVDKFGDVPAFPPPPPPPPPLPPQAPSKE